MNLQERWSRQRPQADPRPAPVLDIATGRPILRDPWLAWRRRRMMRAGVAVAAVIGVAALIYAIDMRSRQAATAPSSVSATVQPEDILSPDPALPPPALLPTDLPSLAASDAAELPAPPQAAVLPPGTDTVLAEPIVEDMPEPARKPSSTLVFDADAAAPDAEGGGPVLIGAKNKATAAPRKPAAGRGVLSRGTLIPAVLESVIDTRKPGTVRAVVGVDVRAADGRTLLVPRSSRLVGQYRAQADRKAGWAYVLWTRLIRPDGSEVALASAGEAARFMESYAAAPLVSMVGDAGDPADPVRARRGEPVRIVAARDFTLGS